MAGPGNPHEAQQADATVKLRGEGIISLRQARRDLGYSSVQIRNMEQDDADEQQTDPIIRAANAFRLPPPALGELTTETGAE